MADYLPRQLYTSGCACLCAKEKCNVYRVRWISTTLTVARALSTHSVEPPHNSGDCRYRPSYAATSHHVSCNPSCSSAHIFCIYVEAYADTTTYKHKYKCKCKCIHATVPNIRVVSAVRSALECVCFILTLPVSGKIDISWVRVYLVSASALASVLCT